MNRKKAAFPETLSQAEIDDRVIAEINDPSAWEEPLEAHRDFPLQRSRAAELAVRASVLAKNGR